MFARALAILAAVAPLSAQEADPLLARLPANTTNLLVVRDVLPHVENVLASPQLRSLLVATGDIQQELFGMRLDPAKLRQQLGLVRAFIPEEVVIAGSPTTVESFLRFSNAAFAAMSLPLLAQRGEEVKDLVADLRAAAADAIRNFRSPDLVAWIRLRDERTAEGWFDSVVQVFEALPRDSAELALEESTMSLRLRLLQLKDGQMRAELASGGVDLPPDADALLVARLEQRGATLELRLGEPAVGPLDTSRLGPMWRMSASDVLFVKIDLGDAAASVHQCADRLFAIASSIPDVSMSANMHRMASNMLGATVPTTTSLVVDNGFVLTREADYGERVELVRPADALVRCIARDEGPFMLCTWQLETLLSSLWDQIILQRTQGGQEVPSWASPLAEYLASDDAALFEAGTLLVARPAVFRGALKLGLMSMPFAAVAVVAKANDDASAKEFMRQATARIVSNASPWVEQDLGLGVVTQVLDLERAGFVELGIDADFRPHWFVVDSVLVVSTDPAISEDLVARIRGGVPELPARKLIDWSWWPGDHWSAACAGIAQWSRRLTESLDPVPYAKWEAMLDGLGALCETADGLETITTIEGSTMRHVTTLRLRAK